MASRAEQTRDQWATAFEGITLANGYRHDIGGVSKAIPTLQQMTGLVFPHVAIEFGKSVFEFLDSTWTVDDELVDVHIAGFVTADTETAPLVTASKMMDAMEALIHDLVRKILSDLLTVNSNHATNPWVVSKATKKLEFQRIGMLYEQRNFGMVTTSLVIRIKNQTFETSGAIIQDEAGAFIELEG